MLKAKLIKGAVAVSAVAALYAALAVQAQTGAGQAATGQTAGQGTKAQPGATGIPSATQAGSSTASGSGAMGGPAMSRADQKMVKDMAMANLAEVEAGRMAHGKTQNEQVRNFAQQMIDDHTKALGDVQQLAQAKGVLLPTELDRAHKRMVERMAALSGDAFDRAYMQQAGVESHKKVHGLLQKAQSRAKDPELKALAARTMPIVDQHLSSAQQLHKDTARGSSRTQGTTGASPDKPQ
jgi:putative membrane protein